MPGKHLEQLMAINGRAIFTVAGSRARVRAGWIHQPRGDWGLFSGRWMDALHQAPRIEYFKMNEANSFTGQFAGWGYDDRDQKMPGSLLSLILSALIIDQSGECHAIGSQLNALTADSGQSK